MNGHREEELRKRLLSIFNEEAEEQLSLMSSNFIELEKDITDERKAELIETAFRAAHSLKGAARTVALEDIGRVCQALESVMSELKSKTLQPSTEIIGVLLGSVKLLVQLKRSQEENTGEKIPTAPIIQELNALLHPAEKLSPAKKNPVKIPVVSSRAEPPASASVTVSPLTLPEKPQDSGERKSGETIRVSIALLDSIRSQAEELADEKVWAGHIGEMLLNLRGRMAGWQKQFEVQQQVLRSRRDTNGRSFKEDSGESSDAVNELLAWNKDVLKSMDQQIGLLQSESTRFQRSLSTKMSDLIEQSLKLLMLPCAWLFEGARQVVRDLAIDLGKEVDFEIEGEAIEIDRRILAELKAPLTHVLRNCLDHGIETPAQRALARKSPRGYIKIMIAQIPGGRVEIVVKDDGQGIDPKKVKAAAIKSGVLREEDAKNLGDAELVNLAFRSSVSTSPIITDLSGRGLGLAIVQERVEKLGGTVSLESVPGAGSTIRFEIPVSLTAYRGIVVKVGNDPFVLPIMSVEQVVRFKKDEIKSAGNRQTIQFRERTTLLIRLADVLGLALTPAREEESRDIYCAVIVPSPAGRVAFLVDEIAREQEVLVKGLGPQLAELPHLGGVTVLGDGRMALVLDATHLAQVALARADTIARPAAVSGNEAAAPRKKHSVLVAEDSITSRTLLKGILEGAGYAVETAVDGFDAYEKLRAGAFDLVVSDVDMPRLNGLAMTAKIRADKKFGDIPVVLVTSLESKEDRERGIDVGANAYIVKRSFERSNLLEVISRFL